MKGEARRRSLLHVDLDPFFVSVERRLDPSLAGRPVIVGGDSAASGVVAAASPEARARGVHPGQALALARRACPDACWRPGDFDAYARVSQEVTAILLAASRRVERPSVDEAYLDLTPEGTASAQPATAAENIKNQIQQRLGLDASLGLAGSRLAARVASTWARPRGLLIVLPGYETAFLAPKPLSTLPDLPPHLERSLSAAGLTTLGQVSATAPDALAAIVGPVAAARLQQEARGEAEETIQVAAPPTRIQEEARVRARGSDRTALESLLAGLASRAVRRLRPFGLVAAAITVEVRRGSSWQRRNETVQPGLADEETAQAVARGLAAPLLEPPSAVRGILLRLSRLSRPVPQVPLFPWSARVAR
jgi:DNA polymerase-4